MLLAIKRLISLSIVFGVFLTTPENNFKKLDREIENSKTISEKLLKCTYMQDALISYLHEAKGQEEFLRGMAAIEPQIRHFHESLRYAATSINFFNPDCPKSLVSQPIKFGDRVVFLNTFKTGRKLGHCDREKLYCEERLQYEKEATTEPFNLSAETLKTLESGKIYNFVLLPDSTVRVALEKPGGKEYYIECSSDFAYPNHSILAGGPNQPILSAGSLIIYRVKDKQLIFICNKSGHFVPSYESLNGLKEQLYSLGAGPHTVIVVPAVNLSQVVLSQYHSIRIPLSLTQENITKLFHVAHARWVKAFDTLDYNLLTELSQGNISHLTMDNIREINNIREEATYMRSAYHLLSFNHQAPAQFHQFVKRFGNLKDGIKHNVTEVIIKEAAWLKRFNDKILRNDSFVPTKEDSVHKFLKSEIQTIKLLLARKELTLDEFHYTKKAVRELGSLFLSLSEQSFESGSNFSIYQAASWKLFQINQQLALIHDEQVGKIMHGEITKDKIVLEIPSNTKNHLNRLLNQFVTP